MRPRFLVIALAQLVAAAFACSSSETKNEKDPQGAQFFGQCNINAECRDGLFCMCGRCTMPCGERACPADVNAACLDAASSNAQALCGAPAGTRLCFPACTTDADCQEGMHCANGGCSPPASGGGGGQDGGQAGAGGSPGGSGGAGTGGSGGGSSGAGPVGECTGLERTACQESPACDPVFGLRGGDTVPSYAGCIASASCDLAITCARAEQGSCYEFPTSCVPDAWETIPCSTAGCPAGITVDAGSTFECHQGLRCSLAEQYCLILYPGISDAATTASCEPFPEGCSSCACMPSQTGSCSETPEGGIRMSLLPP